MITAIIIAGGVGHRMGQEIPKQFINVGDKPVIVYTLEAFQEHPQVDAIEVVCLDGWQEVLKAYASSASLSSSGSPRAAPPGRSPSGTACTRWRESSPTTTYA